MIFGLSTTSEYLMLTQWHLTNVKVGTDIFGRDYNNYSYIFYY